MGLIIHRPSRNRHGAGDLDDPPRRSGGSGGGVGRSAKLDDDDDWDAVRPRQTTASSRTDRGKPQVGDAVVQRSTLRLQPAESLKSEAD